MTDVRLTALNPEDSQVYPVACNSSGELLVDKGDPVEYVEKSGDNMTGDLTLGTDKITLGIDGSSSFAGGITSGGDQVLLPGSMNVYQSSNSGSTAVYNGGWDTGGGRNITSTIYSNGRASFAGSVTSGGPTIVGGTNRGCQLGEEGNAAITSASSSSALRVYTLNNLTPTVDVLGNGSASFAGGKAGFTAEGYLWCTTRRGDTVILDATSNGIANWVDYTPPTRREQLEEKLEEEVEQIREEGEKGDESSESL